MIRVLVADDQAMVRTGFRMILDNEPDVEVVADVADGTSAVRVARELRPDVCLLDIRMPGVDGLAATRLLAGPDVAAPIKVVVVTTFDLDEYVYEALAAGASGFLLKDAEPALLVASVRAAVQGDAMISPQITVRLLRELRRLGPRGPQPPPVALTDRELDVVRAAAQGMTNGEIAVHLHMSLSTVKTHLAAVHAKLGARNRVQVTAWAWRSGLVS